MATTTAATTAEIQTLYVAYFNRPADPLGLQVLQSSGASQAQLAAGFSASAEFTATYAGKSPLDLVNSIYLNLFGRPAETAGLLFWASRLQAGQETFQSLVLTIAGAAQNEDKIAIDSKVAAATAFTESLTTERELLGYDGSAANAVVKTWLSGVTSEATLASSTTEAALNATAEAAAVARDDVVSPPTTIALTTGTDAIVGTAGNDIINAVLNNTGTGQAQTLNAFDSINGGLGNNTLNINDFSTGGTTDALNSVTVRNIQTLNLGSQQAVNLDTTAVTGLTSLSVSAIGAESITAANTTAITANASQVAGANVTIAGGSSINATVAGVTTGGAINVGSSTTAGAINLVVSDRAPAIDTNSTGSTITVAGGTTVNVTQNIAVGTTSAGAVGSFVATGGNIVVNGGAATTAVTVNQTAAAAATAGVAAVAAVPAVPGVTENSLVTWNGFAIGGVASQTVGGYTVQTDGVATHTAADVAAVAAGGAVAGLSLTATNSAWTVATTSNTGETSFVSTTADTNVSNITTGSATGGASSPVITFGQNGSAAVPGTPAVAAVAAVAGVAVGGIVITDANSANTDSTKANTITSVTLNNYAGATINSNALSTLSLTNGSGTVTVNDNSATATALTLGLTVNGLKSGAGLVDAKATTLNIAATGANSALNVNGAALKTITVSGDKSLNLTGSTTALVTAITSTNSAGVTTSLNVDQAGTFSAGNNTVTVAGGATKAITFGAGNDTVNITTLASTASIAGGAGTDTLGISAANAVFASGAAFTQVTGFEVLSVGAVGAASVINLTNLNNSGANAFNKVVVAGATNALTLNGLTANNTLELTAAATGQTITANLADATGAADVLNISVKNAAGINAGTIVAANVETINFATDDTATTATGIQHTATLTDAAAKSISVTGDAGLALTFAGTALTTFNAGGVTKGAVSWTSGNLDAAVTVTGGAGANTIDLGATTKAVTYTGGAGVDTITTGAGTATVTTGAGADVITLGAGAATVNAGAGNDIINLGSGLNIVTGGAGNDTFNLNGVVIPNGNTYSTITDFSAGDSIVFSTGTFAAAALGARVTLAGTAAFADFLQAAAASTFAVGADSAVKWFQFGGDTYVVNDRTANNTSFVNGADQVIKLTGIVDLSASTTSATGIVTFVAAA